MTLALYRKYRPKTFKEVVGQNHIKTTLQSELETDKVAHAYLFSGPRGLGKTTTARLLAKAVNCQKRSKDKSEPCNECDACRQIIDNKTLDVIEIDAASHTGVDNVRENIIENSRFTPSGLKFKVFIIDEVHMLSASAFNALLKTLEEPPLHAMFILATTEIHKVPQTIISRCQHFDFRPVNVEDIVGRLSHLVSLEGKKVDPVVLESIAYYCGGSIRDAESLLGQVLTLDEKNITAEQAELVLPRARFDLALDLIDLINKKDISGSITLINNLVQEGVNLEKFVDNLIEMFRKVLLVKVDSRLGQFATALNKSFEKRILDTIDHIDQIFIVKAIDVLIKRKSEVRSTDIKQLPLELAVVEIILLTDDEEFGGQAVIKKDKRVEDLVKPSVVKTEIVSDQPLAIKAERQKQELSQLKSNGPVKKNKIKITLDQINKKWDDVLSSLKDYNQSLASTLKIGQPKSVKDDGILEVSFQHEFHEQRINDVKNKDLLERILKDTFGVDLIVKTVIVKAINQPVIQPKFSSVVDDVDENFDDLASAFGGQIVE